MPVRKRQRTSSSTSLDASTIKDEPQDSSQLSTITSQVSSGTTRGIPKLTVEQVENYLERMDSARAGRAMDYFESGMISDIFLQDNVITAQVQGSYADEYDVRIEFNENCSPNEKSVGKIVKSFKCSCPDWGYPCKHAGAVLLKWASNPRRIDALPPMRSLLENKSKEELVKLIEELCKENGEVGRIINSKLNPNMTTSIYGGDEGDEEDEEEDEDEE